MSQIDLQDKNLAQLLNEYENGQIQLKTIGDLLEMTPHELFQAVATHQIECPITPELDDYTRDITDSIIKKIQLENG